MRYNVTLEPALQIEHPLAPLLRVTIDADDKDHALDDAESAYRRLYPDAGELRTRVMRLRPPAA